MTRRSLSPFSLLACEQRPATHLLIALCFLFASTLPSSAGTLRTVDGKSYDGELRLESGQILLSQPKKSTVKIDLADLLSADFSSTGPPAPTATAPTKLPPEWKPTDVGAAAPGHVTLTAGKWLLHGAGNNIAAQADSFFFLHQTTSGDCQLVARLDDLQHAAPGAKVGLMLRASTDRSSPNALLALIPQEGVVFSFRAEPAANTSRATAPEDSMPVWLRLTRAGNTVTAYKAAESGEWTPVGKPINLPLDAKPLVGLAVCSHDPDNAVAAVFQGVRLIPSATDVPPTTLNPALQPLAQSGRGATPIGDMLGRSVVLHNGTILAHATIQSADAKTIHLTNSEGQPLALPATEVARLVLAPVTPAQLAKIPAHGAGVLLARGDFLESEFESLGDGHVKMNSVVFGPSNLGAGTEALVVVLRDVVTTATPWLVKTNDGYAYAAKSARIDGSDLLIEDDANKSVKIPSGNVASIRAGASRFDSLADLRPVDSTPAPVPPNTTLGKRPVEKPLAGSPLTYDLATKYRLFTCRAGVPDNSLPTLSVQFTILLDGKEVFRSPPRTSLDDPLTISLDLVANAKSITLRIDPANNLPLPATGVWADPVLIK